MTKTANSGASEANASNLSGSTGNTQEDPKESASWHSETEPSNHQAGINSSTGVAEHRKEQK